MSAPYYVKEDASHICTATKKSDGFQGAIARAFDEILLKKQKKPGSPGSKGGKLDSFVVFYENLEQYPQMSLVDAQAD